MYRIQWNKYIFHFFWHQKCRATSGIVPCQLMGWPGSSQRSLLIVTITVSYMMSLHFMKFQSLYWCENYRTRQGLKFELRKISELPSSHLSHHKDFFLPLWYLYWHWPSTKIPCEVLLTCLPWPKILYCKSKHSYTESKFKVNSACGASEILSTSRLHSAAPWPHKEICC